MFTFHISSQIRSDTLVFTQSISTSTGLYSASSFSLILSALLSRFCSTTKSFKL
ncbi:MAG: hypothetical protein Q8S84_06745 [bacterium]|nr:hypothetical protein [bacterium]